MGRRRRSLRWLPDLTAGVRHRVDSYRLPVRRVRLLAVHLTRVMGLRLTRRPVLGLDGLWGRLGLHLLRQRGRLSLELVDVEDTGEGGDDERRDEAEERQIDGGFEAGGAQEE